jgi:hypothetical protein
VVKGHTLAFSVKSGLPTLWEVAVLLCQLHATTHDWSIKIPWNSMIPLILPVPYTDHYSEVMAYNDDKYASEYEKNAINKAKVRDSLTY